MIDINKDILDVICKVSSKVVDATGRSSSIRVENTWIGRRPSKE